tara:strand:- start:174 stop:1073 length:900 start_codon:yes stop_codon:yes gene_type:complete
MSKKLDQSLMDAYASIYEARRGHAAGASDLEKQASQLASDVRYKAKGRVKEGTNREELKKVYLGLIQSSPAPNVVKQMAKKKLIGEEAVNEMRFDDGKEGTEKRKEALRKKRGMTKDQMDKHPQFKDDMKEGSAYGIYKGDGKMKIGKRDEGEKAPRMQKGAMAYDGPNKERSEAADRVLAKTKKKREKMNEMSCPSPKVVETSSKSKERKMTPNILDKIRKLNTGAGSQFEQVVHEKMDPVGQEDKDIDNDGDHDSTDKYLANRRKAIGKAIAKKRGRVKEGFSAWRIELDFQEQVKK